MLPYVHALLLRQGRVTPSEWNSSFSLLFQEDFVECPQRKEDAFSVAGEFIRNAFIIFKLAPYFVHAKWDLHIDQSDDL